MNRLLIVIITVVSLTAPSTVAVPIDPGMGPARTAVGSGPLAPLWNAAGAVDTPGVHGAFTVTLGASDETTLLIGASIAAANSPTVCWSMYKLGSEQETWGTFAFPILSETSAGLGVAYAFGAESGISFHAGILYRGGGWAFAASAMHIASGLFGGNLPFDARAGAAIYSIPGVTLTGNITLAGGKFTLAIGGEATIWVIALRWGLSIIPTGGIERAGIGLGFDLLSIPVDVSVGVNGSSFRPYASLGISANIPAWW
jgi:hypothetical protein